MKQIEFIRHKKEEQWVLLWERGEFITERIKGEHTFSLYSLGITYIEVTFDLESGKAINIEAFTDLNALAPYLDSVVFIFL